jgi:putative Mg2+ transporter-C (MgtC) family protein
MITFPTILLRLGLALVLGAIVGFERESREHAAGMRTDALVSLGSCLFTIISAFGFMDLLGIAHIQLDPTRIASYIVAGIGFLGAGTIFLQPQTKRVRGLTTAATIWLLAAIGMACGAGLIVVAVATTIMALVVLVGLRVVERLLLPRQSSEFQHITIEATSMAGQFIGQVCDTFAHTGISIERLEIRAEQERATVKVGCRLSDVTKLAHLIGELRTLPGVRAVHTDLHGSRMENLVSAGRMDDDS